MPKMQARCRGIAYQLPCAAAPEILAALDAREQGGYQRRSVQIFLEGERETTAMTWIAPADNPHFLGPASSAGIAAHIAAASGPSGTNLDYFERLCMALDNLGSREPHLRRIARWINPQAGFAPLM